MSADPADALAALRARVDHIDTDIVRLLADRQNAVDAIAAVKRAHAIRAHDEARESDILAAALQEAARLGVAPEVVEDVLRAILKHSRARVVGAADLQR